MPLKSAFPDIKPVEAQNLADYVLTGATANFEPNAPVFIDSDKEERVSFSQFRKNVDTVARALHAYKVQKGDVVAMCLPNCLEYMSIMLGIISRGAVFCGVNPNYTAEEYEHNLTDSTARLVFVSPESTRNICAAIKKLGGSQKVVLVGVPPKEVPPVGVSYYKEFLASSQTATDLPTVNLNPETDAALMLFSSGTTGRPKGVMHSHVRFCIGLQLTCELTLYDHAKKGDIIIGVLPMFHNMGLMISLNNIRRGATTVTVRKPEPEKLLRLIQKYRVRLIYAAPPTLVFLAKDARTDKYDLTSLRCIQTGAAPVGKELHDELGAKFPHITHISQGYGMTETGGASFFTPKWKAKPGSTGTLVPNYSAKVVNVDTGKECGPNELGEIWVSGPGFMLGYFRNPKATADTIDRDNWLHTGDIGYYDDEGYFFIVDRLKELIKVNAFQVSPAELEDILIAHPAVEDAAVIARPDPKSGEVPKAYVVKGQLAQVTEDELIHFVAERVVYYKRLKGGVEFVDAIPKSVSGKILRRVMQQQEKEKHAKSTSKL